MSQHTSALAKQAAAPRRSNLWAVIRKDKLLYIMAIPGILYFIIFHYIPMSGTYMAFIKYNIYKGFTTSPWVGLQNFEKLFATYGFIDAIKNTLTISFWKILIGFPMPILFAILLNEVRSKYFKKMVQTRVCLPHFISWIVV